MSPPNRRGFLIYNPTAGQRGRSHSPGRLIAQLRAEGVELTGAPTEGPGHATRIVEESLKEEPDIIVVDGGDGTVSEAAAPLLGTDVALALLPGGTSNVLAIELGIPLDRWQAQKLIVRGAVRRLRPGLANGRPFLLMAGTGLDARVMGHMKPSLKRWLGRAGIFLTVVPEFFGYEFPRLDVEVEGAHYPATFAVVARAKSYAGNWLVAPSADLSNDTLEVLLFNSRSRKDFFNLFRGMKGRQGRHLEVPGTRILRGKSAGITSLENYSVETQLDGDCVLATPLHCAVSDKTLNVVVP